MVVRMYTLKQGVKELRDYVEEAEEIASMLPPGWETAMTRAFIDGLANETAAITLRAAVYRNELVDVHSAIEMARACLNDQVEVTSETIEEQAKSTDEALMEALLMQGRLIEQLLHYVSESSPQ